MTPTTAIQRAEQWRKEGACGEAAKVAIALLNELERVQASRAIPEGHVVVPGWMPIETAPKVRNEEILLLVDGKPKAGYWWVQEYYEQRDADGNYKDHQDYAEGWATYYGDFDVEPAGWMPLPAAPAPEGEA